MPETGREGILSQSPPSRGNFWFPNPMMERPPSVSGGHLDGPGDRR